MWFRSEKAEAVISYDICNVTTTEMRQMATMRDRVETILNSHRDKDTKKQYLSDDELEKIWAILSVLTDNCSGNTNTAFDEFLKEHQFKPQTD